MTSPGFGTEQNALAKPFPFPSFTPSNTLLTGDATTGLKTLLLLFKVILVAITTAIGKAGAVFSEGVVVPARDALLADARVWQVHAVPWRVRYRQRGEKVHGAFLLPSTRLPVVAVRHLPTSIVLKKAVVQ